MKKEKVKRTFEPGHFFFFLVGIKSSRILKSPSAAGAPRLSGPVAAHFEPNRGIDAFIFLTLPRPRRPLQARSRAGLTLWMPNSLEIKTEVVKHRRPAGSWG